MQKILVVELSDGQVLRYEDVQKVWEIDDTYVVRSITGDNKAVFAKDAVIQYYFEDGPDE